jgi:hypothetical protein
MIEFHLKLQITYQNVNGSLKLTHFAAKNDKVKLTHP